MSFIDWSDPEGMVGLLVEYVAQEQTDAADSGRRAFLSRLKRQLQELEEHFGASSLPEAIRALRAIRRSTGDEFEADSVIEHVDACIEELERVYESA